MFPKAGKQAIRKSPKIARPLGLFRAELTCSDGSPFAPASLLRCTLGFPALHDVMTVSLAQGSIKEGTLEMVAHPEKREQRSLLSFSLISSSGTKRVTTGKLSTDEGKGLRKEEKETERKGKPKTGKPGSSRTEFYLGFLSR